MWHPVRSYTTRFPAVTIGTTTVSIDVETEPGATSRARHVPTAAQGPQRGPGSWQTKTDNAERASYGDRLS